MSCLIGVFFKLVLSNQALCISDASHSFFLHLYPNNHGYINNPVCYDLTWDKLGYEDIKRGLIYFVWGLFEYDLLPHPGGQFLQPSAVQQLPSSQHGCPAQAQALPSVNNEWRRGIIWDQLQHNAHIIYCMETETEQSMTMQKWLVYLLFLIQYWLDFD